MGPDGRYEIMFYIADWSGSGPDHIDICDGLSYLIRAFQVDAGQSSVLGAHGFGLRCWSCVLGHLHGISILAGSFPLARGPSHASNHLRVGEVGRGVRRDPEICD